MLRKLRNLPLLCTQFVAHSDVQLCNVAFTKKFDFFNHIYDIKYFHICSPMNESQHSRKSTRTGEKDESKFADFSHGSKHVFPEINLPNELFSGVLFKDLPVVNIKVTRNNTIMNLTDHKGATKLIRSCGVEGFKNTKKGTNLAAQATALTFSRRALDMGFKTVRVRIQGIGPGRVSSIRGLVIGGLDIVSITDNSHVADVFPRPKKMRRI